MIHGIGTDLCDTRRIQRRVAAGRHGALFRRVLTDAEVRYCEAAPRAAHAFAARFAAKEAWLKAASVPRGVALREIEVVRASNGAPEINVHGRARDFCVLRKITRTLVTLSHDGDYAVATVLLLAEG